MADWRKNRTAARFTPGTLAAAGIGAALGLRGLLRRPRYSFEGRTVLVTGGSRGLGLVLCRQLVREGARVALCGRDTQSLERALEELEREGGEVLALPCDVRDSVQVEAMVGAVLEHWGAVDVLINNAGTIQVGPMESMTVEDFEDAVDTHLWGPLYTTLAVLPAMKQRREGRIVNIASVGGRLSVPHLLPYSASKFALVGLSDGLRAELRQDGIRVTTVCPGLMRTGSPLNARFKGQHEAEYAWFSISDSLPGVSVSAERSARLILDGCRRGDAEVLVGAAAKLGAVGRALAPELTATLLAWANRLLPQSSSQDAHRGVDSQTPLTRSWLTELSRRAAERNNNQDVPLH
ncbi:SDR family oxidoreductase [Myxococcus sp. MISCRS1]|jgi:NAD(P)-dependent dehydrogenase (short-subunit alcohol dehydrogenase family)|uniref:SDR family NAD(P)-dependent oxidoreductase n=1 Tax=Myxococcus TaxID=32 RepID=UPI001CBC1C0F|nr:MULTISPECIES: SDR family oxidoreductase [unclassified Myxococcus]MBZ4400346.1 SDR family oxidoreductase [Myxococcus sp. AS-1-15]MCY0998034.1 SDR family oxidoreductase [Myxococcus sp. MISCRS1]BDT31905.1 SDR family oxidoreductase [Myxococcus sp. MH1]